jgi:ferritin-like metal-binding protein YciE
VKALPEMAKASTSQELRSGFEEHLEQTKVHVDRLERIFKDLGKEPSDKKCKGRLVMVSEGSGSDRCEEEKATDQKLTELAEEINVHAAGGDGSGAYVFQPTSFKTRALTVRSCHKTQRRLENAEQEEE